jgi:hypothetical protein
LRCLLTIDRKCEINKCENGGECISNDDDLISNEGLICNCPEGYSGYRCQIVNNEISLAFLKDIVLSQDIFIHFI